MITRQNRPNKFEDLGLDILEGWACEDYLYWLTLAVQGSLNGFRCMARLDKAWS